MGIGSFLFNFIGACTRWFWGQIRMKIFGGQKYTFKDYLNGPQNSNDEIIDRYGHGFVNNIIGAIVILVIVCLSIRFMA